MNERVYGIDLGTSTSAVAWGDAHGERAIRALPFRAGASFLTPSEVCLLEDGRAVVGVDAALAEARETTIEGDEPVRKRFAVFKREMGEQVSGPEWAHGGVAWDPVSLSALVLRKLQRDVEANDSLDRAVITHPQQFYVRQKNATKAAAALAGIDIALTVSEPYAAAIAAGWRPGGKQGVVVLLDLGGGTFDVNVIACEGARMSVLGCNGDPKLGGHDFDKVVWDMFDEAHQHNFDRGQGAGYGVCDRAEALDWARLAKRTKEQLQSSDIVEAAPIAGGNHVLLSIREAEFARRCDGLMRRIDEGVELALANAGLPWGEVTEAVLAGGSARLKVVQRWLEGRIGPERWRVANDPDMAVTKGAAWLGGRIARGEDLVDFDEGRPQNRLPRNIGVLVKRSGVLVASAPIAPEGARLPGLFQRRFKTADPNATSLKVQVVEWDSQIHPDVVPDPVGIGAVQIELARGLPAGTPVDLILALDLGGGLEVRARVDDIETRARIDGWQPGSARSVGGAAMVAGRIPILVESP